MRKVLALVAHDAKKEEMVQLVKERAGRIGTAETMRRPQHPAGDQSGLSRGNPASDGRTPGSFSQAPN